MNKEKKNPIKNSNFMLWFLIYGFMFLLLWTWLNRWKPRSL